MNEKQKSKLTRLLKQLFQEEKLFKNGFAVTTKGQTIIIKPRRDGVFNIAKTETKLTLDETLHSNPLILLMRCEDSTARRVIKGFLNNHKEFDTMYKLVTIEAAELIKLRRCSELTLSMMSDWLATLGLHIEMTFTKSKRKKFVK